MVENWRYMTVEEDEWLRQQAKKAGVTYTRQTRMVRYCSGVMACREAEGCICAACQKKREKKEKKR